MQRPNEREFLKAVLESMSDLPEGFSERLVKLVEENPEDRPEAICRLIEEATRE